MKRLIALALLVTAVSGCTTKKEYVTNVNGPTDWQGPVITWTTPPDSPLRGTVGLDVSVRDSSRVDSVVLFVDGREAESVVQRPYRFEVHSDSLTDGVHICEARAWDQFGNLGISPVLRVFAANGTVEGIRLIWVPDSFASIQAAINAATDFDTIRVKDGTYYETLNTFGKGIWMESERGPLRCTLDDAGANDVLYIEGNEVMATIRGFHLTGISWMIYLWAAGQARICNNIFQSDSADSYVVMLNSGGLVANNYFSGGVTQVQPGYFSGRIVNNIMQGAREYAFYNPSQFGNPVVFGYNLFWDNAHDYARIAPAVTDVHADPMIDLDGGRLRDGSPAIDAGDPTILDRDETRSDIGPFGGPLAYNP